MNKKYKIKTIMMMKRISSNNNIKNKKLKLRLKTIRFLRKVLKLIEIKILFNKNYIMVNKIQYFNDI